MGVAFPSQGSSNDAFSRIGAVSRFDPFAQV
jgi:hypothetical protein